MCSRHRATRGKVLSVPAPAHVRGAGYNPNLTNPGHRREPSEDRFTVDLKSSDVYRSSCLGRIVCPLFDPGRMPT